MGLGGENGKVVESWDVCKTKGRKKKKKEDEDLDEAQAGCWVRLRFIGSCISSRSKVDSSVSGSDTNTHYGNYHVVVSAIVVVPVMVCLDIPFLKVCL